MKAINRGHCLGWPGLTASRVRKWLPDSEETVMGHQQLVQQGVRSTSKSVNNGENETAEEARISKGDANGTDGTTGDAMTSKGALPTSVTMGRQRHVIACSAPTEELRGLTGADQTGRFPHVSDRGHKHVFILADVDADCICGAPIESRKASELVRAFEEACDTSSACGFQPRLHRIDHETSKDLITAIKERNSQCEIMPPANHRQNPAERAIGTSKSHFTSIINGLDEGFPSGGWDSLMPQVNVTLNMLRTCTVNPAHSACSCVHGAFDHSAHPPAPLGCKATVHQRRIHNGGPRCGWENKGKIGPDQTPQSKDPQQMSLHDQRQGHGDVKGMDVVAFVARHKMPDGKKAAHARHVVDHCPEKDEAWCLQITWVGMNWTVVETLLPKVHPWKLSSVN